MRIAAHDFVGHAFQVQLSRELARRGHEVLHIHFAGFKSPNDVPASTASDAPSLTIAPITLGGEYPKYNYLRRCLADRRYIKACTALLSVFSPDVVISANASPIIQGGLQSHCRRASIGFVNWVQDCYGIAAERIFSRRLGVVGSLIGRYVRRKEEEIVRSSDAVVFISSDFHSAFPNIAKGKATVIENWAPFDDLPPRPRVNAWGIANNLVDKKVLLYSGTLGLKHNPDLLVKLALHARQTPEAVLVVISEGLGRAYLETRKKELNLSNLQLMDFQPFDVLPEVTASADVLIAMVEKDAGAYSVPSKVLTYLCAGRPLLLSVPSSNLAARIVSGIEAGVTDDPDDVDGFVRGAYDLLFDQGRALALAANARAYACSTFDITRIADEFEGVLSSVVQSRSESVPHPTAWFKRIFSGTP